MSLIQIVEVGLRDGLQNEKQIVSLNDRLSLANQLLASGVRRLEIGAFVKPEKIPQMAQTKELVDQFFKTHPKQDKVSVLVPNERGMRAALETRVKEVAIFASCSESFSKKNINCSIEESFERFPPIFALAKKNKIRVRGYLSVCFGCPYEGKVSEQKVITLAKRMLKAGCFEVSIGDTIGVASPLQVKSLLSKAKKALPMNRLAMHFHDTRGTALANVYQAHLMGVRVFDSSLGGLGGCPYAPGASGNVVTEDVVYMFHTMKLRTGINLEKLILTSQTLQKILGRELSSKVGKAGMPKPLGRIF